MGRPWGAPRLCAANLRAGGPGPPQAGGQAGGVQPTVGLGGRVRACPPPSVAVVQPARRAASAPGVQERRGEARRGAARGPGAGEERRAAHCARDRGPIPRPATRSESYLPLSAPLGCVGEATGLRERAKALMRGSAPGR